MRIAMIAITTNSSINVNPRSRRDMSGVPIRSYLNSETMYGETKIRPASRWVLAAPPGRPGPGQGDPGSRSQGNSNPDYVDYMKTRSVSRESGIGLERVGGRRAGVVDFVFHPVVP